MILQLAWISLSKATISGFFILVEENIERLKFKPRFVFRRVKI